VRFYRVSEGCGWLAVTSYNQPVDKKRQTELLVNQTKIKNSADVNIQEVFGR